MSTVSSRSRAATIHQQATPGFSTCLSQLPFRARLGAADGSHLTQRLVQGLVARAARRASLRNVGVHGRRHKCEEVAGNWRPLAVS
jgi:hypothetical protein